MDPMKNPKFAVEAYAERRRFFELAERLQKSTNPAAIEQIKKELARRTFASAAQS